MGFLEARLLYITFMGLICLVTSFTLGRPAGQTPPPPQTHTGHIPVFPDSRAKRSTKTSLFAHRHQISMRFHNKNDLKSCTLVSSFCIRSLIQSDSYTGHDHRPWMFSQVLWKSDAINKYMGVFTETQSTKTLICYLLFLNKAMFLHQHL